MRAGSPFDTLHNVGWLLVACAAFFLASWLFGSALKLSDLLQEHGYRWFPVADLAVGTFCAALGIGILSFADLSLRILWLAILTHWVLRGRIDGANHGVMAAPMLIYLLVTGTPVGEHTTLFAYFFGVLLTFGAIHDVLQYTKVRRPRAIAWFFENQHLYWYLLGLGHWFLFELDPPLLASLVGFVKGYGFFYIPHNRRWLHRIGVRPPPGHAIEEAPVT